VTTQRFHDRGLAGMLLAFVLLGVGIGLLLSPLIVPLARACFE
jgi:hypothetical protein